MNELIVLDIALDPTFSIYEASRRTEWHEADFVIVEENQHENLQVLYGTGVIRLTDDNKVVRAGGVKYTVKDGIIYDAKKLLADFRKMVAEEKAKTGFVLKQPGIE